MSAAQSQNDCLQAVSVLLEARKRVQVQFTPSHLTEVFGRCNALLGLCVCVKRYVVQHVHYRLDSVAVPTVAHDVE